MFKNIFNHLSSSSRINFQHLVKVRRAKMMQEGYDVDYINWELYAKVLEAKHQNQSHS